MPEIPQYFLEEYVKNQSIEIDSITYFENEIVIVIKKAFFDLPEEKPQEVVMSFKIQSSDNYTWGEFPTKAIAHIMLKALKERYEDLDFTIVQKTNKRNGSNRFSY